MPETNEYLTKHDYCSLNQAAPILSPNPLRTHDRTANTSRRVYVSGVSRYSLAGELQR